MPASDVILSVDDLVTSFTTELGEARAVDGVSFEVKRGRTLGIVGESGCGKSVTSMSIMRLLPKPAGNIVRGRILFEDEDIVQLPANELHRIRGNRISMIFQEPMSALNPVMRIGDQIAESLRLHRTDMSEEDIERETLSLMKKVGIPAPGSRIRSFPHQLSGGMRQRIVIAIALACRPAVLIADEPTTALDVTIQAQILELMRKLQEETGMAIIFITHDLGVIAETCDEVVVMYGGRVVEHCDVETLFKNPRHPYTQGLLSSIPKLDSTPKTKLQTIEGMVPSLFEMPVGCRFQNRCDYAQDICKAEPPKPTEVTPGHHVRCYRWKEISSEH